MAAGSVAGVDDLHPCEALVRVWRGETLLAESSRAATTAWPESSGELLIPEADVRMGLLRPVQDGSDRQRLAAEGEPVAWRDGRSAAAGEPLIGFDAAKLRIEMTDRRRGAERGVATTNRFPRWGDIADLLRLLDVAPAGDDLFECPPYGDVRRNVVEGSQLLAQTMVAAAKSAPGQRVVSAHTIFSRPAV